MSQPGAAHQGCFQWALHFHPRIPLGVTGSCLRVRVPPASTASPPGSLEKARQSAEWESGRIQNRVCLKANLLAHQAPPKHHQLQPTRSAAHNKELAKMPCLPSVSELCCLRDGPPLIALIVGRPVAFLVPPYVFL